MKLEEIVIGRKTTRYEGNLKKYGSHEALGERISYDKLGERVEDHWDYQKTLSELESEFESAGVDCHIVRVPVNSCEVFENKDLIVSLGGDGTTLRTSHYIKDDTPLLPLRTGRSIGVLCSGEADKAGSIIERLLEDDFSIEERMRVAAEFRGRKEYALNEVMVGNKYPRPSYYKLLFKGKEEEQGSSGVVVSSGSGSTGWYGNVWETSNLKSFPRDSKKLRYIVREPMRVEEEGLELLHGEIEEGEEFKIESLMDFNGVICFDSALKFMYDFPLGDTVKLSVSDEPLRVII